MSNAEITKEIKCSYCNHVNKMTDFQIKDLNDYGKAVVECISCKKLISIRDDGDGVYVRLNR